MCTVHNNGLNFTIKKNSLFVPDDNLLPLKYSRLMEGLKKNNNNNVS